MSAKKTLEISLPATSHIWAAAHLLAWFSARSHRHRTGKWDRAPHPKVENTT